MVHGQVQGYNAVAALRVEGGVLRCGCCFRIGGAVPGEAVAHDMGLHACATMTDRQVQGHHAVASGGIGQEAGRRGGAGCVGLSMPGKAVANILDIHIGGAAVDGQVERVDIGAIGIHTVIIGIDSRSGIDLSIPAVAVACRHIIGGVVLRADGEMQGVGAGAAPCIIIVVGVSAVGCIGLPMPCEAVARHLVVAVVCARVDGEIQIDRAVAPMACLGDKDRHGCAGGIDNAEPRVFVTCCHRLSDILRIVDGEVECYYTVAACRILCSIGRCVGG